MRKGRITRRDFAVITTLWLPYIVTAWLESWVGLTIKLVYLPESLNYTVLTVNKFALFVTKCLLCFGLALFADLHGYLKYGIYFISLGLFATTPVFALAMIITKKPLLAYVTPWISSTLFVTTPIQFCLIFNQRISSPYHQTRIIVALFEFFRNVGTFIVVRTASSYEDANPMSLIFIWVSMLSLFVFFLTITDMARKSASREPRKGRNLKGIVASIRKESIFQIGDNRAAKRRKRLVRCQFFIFVVLLLPIICVTVIGKMLPKVANGVGKHVLRSGPPYAVYEVLINLLMIPAFGMGVSFLKGGRGTTADYVLVLAGHVFNTVVVGMIFLFLFEELLNPNYYEVPPVKGSNFTTIQIIHGTVPDDESAVFYAVGNVGFSVKIPGSEHVSSVNNFYEFRAWPARRKNWYMETWTGAHVLHRDFEVKPKTRYMFQTVSDRQTTLKLIQVFGGETITPESHPVLLVMNSIVGETTLDTEVHRDSKQNWLKLKLNRTHNNTYLLPPSDQILRIVTDPGTYNLSIKSIPLNRSGTAFIRMPFAFESNNEYLMLVSVVEPSPQITDIICVQTVNFSISYKDITDNTEPVVKAMFALRGFTSAASTVGYLHFFWIESPIRMRTTLLAGFLVLNEIAAFAADECVFKIDKIETIVLLVISVAGLIIQLSFGLFYDCKLKKELSAPVEETPSTQKPPTKHRTK